MAARYLFRHIRRIKPIKQEGSVTRLKDGGVRIIPAMSDHCRGSVTRTVTRYRNGSIRVAQVDHYGGGGGIAQIRFTADEWRTITAASTYTTGRKEGRP